MKTKRGRKKSSSHKKAKRFFLFNNKVAPVAVIVALLVFTLLLGFVNKTGMAINESTTATITGHSFISDMFANWNAGSLDTNIAKYLFWFMVTVLIWSALSFAKFPENGIAQAFIAIPAGFLAVAYLTPAEIFTVLQSYETLGIVLTFIVPFMLMLFFSAMLLSNERIKSMSVAKIMFEVFLWVFFLVVLGYKMISGLISGQVAFGLNLTMLIMIGVFALSFFILIGNRKFRHWIWGLGNDLRVAVGEAEATTAATASRTAETVERGRRRRSFLGR